MILINPFIIYDLGFQYSVITTYGIIYSSDTLATGNYFFKLFKISFIAFMFSFPITWYNFYEVNLLSVINNIIIVPIVSLIIYPLSLISFIFPIFYSIFDVMIDLLELLNIILSKIGFLRVVIPKLSFLLLIIVYLLIVFAKKLRIFYILLILIVMSCKFVVFLNHKAEVYYLDVGQGDCALIIYPYRKRIVMIDTGGSVNFKKEEWMLRNKNYNISDNVITFLKSLGITNIDLLILSHGDQDHVGETLNILKHINIKNIWFNYGDLNSNEMNIIKSGINFFQSNLHMDISNLNLTMYNDENDDSQITYFSIYSYSFLFLGDISKRVELEQLNDIKNVTFLKIAHHGSKTSSNYETLERINPYISVISAGRNNRYNHPSSETIDTLNSLSLDYYSTQVHGTLKLSLGLTSFTITTYPP